MDPTRDYSWIDTFKGYGWFIEHAYNEIENKRNTGVCIHLNKNFNEISVSTYYPRDSVLWKSNAYNNFCFLEYIKALASIIECWQNKDNDILVNFQELKYNDMKTWIPAGMKAPCVLSFALTNLVLSAEAAFFAKQSIKMSCNYCDLTNSTKENITSFVQLINHGYQFHTQDEKKIPLFLKKAVNSPDTTKLSSVIVKDFEKKVTSNLKINLKRFDCGIEKHLFQN